ncbi:MAG TPA: cytochrome c1 [Stellaceae bacterium]|jgi:ubiquinol-cytochrome c reductase cytochrome c1 subunit
MPLEMSRLVRLAAALAMLLALATVAPTYAQETPPLPHQQWSFDGVFGTYDPAALQRGFQVYKQVCSACHPVTHLYFRDLTAIGYTAAEVKALAATYQCAAGPNDKGQMYQRPCLPADPIPGPFPNEEAARAANGGALPPDQSMLVAAREGGPDYVYAILNGYKPAPSGVEVPSGKYYNEYFPGHMIAMPPPLSAGAVTYADGTKATVPQMAHDAATFLTWASHPNLDSRHIMGAKVFLFLFVTVGIFYAAKRKIWSRIH